MGVGGVQFLLDGSNLGNEVSAPPYSVSLDTTTIGGGAHSVAAVARDFAGNRTTSDPVSFTVTGPSLSQTGQWAGPFNWPIVAVHAALLPNGEVLALDGQEQGGVAIVWNPTTSSITSTPNSFSNLFCAGLGALPNGKALVTGGHVAAFVGIRDTNLFDAVTRTWTPAARMAYARWYPTVTSLPDGRILVMSGSINCKDCIAVPEVYNPVQNVWTALNSAQGVDSLVPVQFCSTRRARAGGRIQFRKHHHTHAGREHANLDHGGSGRGGRRQRGHVHPG